MIRHNGIVLNCRERSITHRGVTWRMHQHRFRALAMLILGDGVSMEQLFFHIYGDREDGGPLAGPHIFQVHFHHWRPIFAQLHLEMRKMKIAGVTFYCLIPKHQFEYADVA